MAHKHSTSDWISMSDMMTGLMLVFLLVAVLFMLQIQKKEQITKDIVNEYSLTKVEIYNELQDAFSEKFDEWGMVLSKDLTIKFIDPEVLFEYRSAYLKYKYREILDEFIPIYIGVINKGKYKDKIKEVRIEGHTASWPSYIYTISLSQDRSNSVLLHILNSAYYNNLEKEDQEKLRFWFTSNGLGNGRSLDEDGEYTYLTDNKVSIKSRRVEFKIITTSDELLEDIITSYKIND